MAKKWLVVGLGVVVVLLFLAAVLGWWQLQQYDGPFLVETAPYRLSDHWYLGEFQPVYLGRVAAGGTETLVVAYRSRSGLLKLGTVMVGGLSGNEMIAPLEVKETYRLGQRFRVQYILYTKTPAEAELATYCQVSPRLCQIAKVVKTTQQPEAVRVAGGKEPQFPVWATEISSQLKALEPQLNL